ncbi:hypothetical protein [Undibacterium sp. TJN19]|uniref:hypothetical protein n=1 Tax=Undibacterium sp. TJN19 TaxID=3413055 RepID=UPI003BF0226B
MKNYTFLAFAAISFVYGIWHLRMRFWPKIQVHVLSTREEITGHDDGFATGWLHAKLEYWHASKKYNVSWRGDLSEHNFLPEAIWMIIPPTEPENPRFQGSLAKPVFALCISVLSVFCYFHSFS